MSNSNVNRSKKSLNLSLGQSYLEVQFFLVAILLKLHQQIVMFLQFKVQFCNNSKFVATFGVIMFFWPLLGNWTLCRLCVVRQETLSHSTWFDKCSIHCAQCFSFALLSFGSTVVINVLINIAFLNLKTQFFSKFGSTAHEYASKLTSTPRAVLFCSCKCRKFIGQNEVKICKLWSQNFKFLGQKIDCLSYNVLHSNELNLAILAKLSQPEPSTGRLLKN